MMAKVYQFDLFKKPGASDETVTNVLWEQFLAACQAASEWRDHDSLDMVERLIARLRPLLELPTIPGN